MFVCMPVTLFMMLYASCFSYFSFFFNKYPLHATLSAKTQTMKGFYLPKLLLCSCGVQRVLQLSPQSFQLLPQVSSLFLCSLSHHSFILHLLLQLGNLGRGLPQSSLSFSTPCAFFLQPDKLKKGESVKILTILILMLLC